MRLFDLNIKQREAYIDLIEHTIMFNICAKMVDKNRKLTSDEIEQIVHVELNKLKEQV